MRQHFNYIFFSTVSPDRLGGVFCRRIWKLSRSWWLPGIIICVALAQGIAACVSGIWVSQSCRQYIRACPTNQITLPSLLSSMILPRFRAFSRQQPSGLAVLHWVSRSRRSRKAGRADCVGTCSGRYDYDQPRQLLGQGEFGLLPDGRRDQQYVVFLCCVSRSTRPTRPPPIELIRNTVETGAVTATAATAELILFLVYKTNNLHMVSLSSRTAFLTSFSNANLVRFLDPVSSEGPDAEDLRIKELIEYHFRAVPSLLPSCIRTRFWQH